MLTALFAAAPGGKIGQSGYLDSGIGKGAAPK